MASGLLGHRRSDPRSGCPPPGRPEAGRLVGRNDHCLGRGLRIGHRESAIRSCPVQAGKSRLTLEPEGDGTAITFAYRYVPKGGPLGRLTGPVIDRMLRTTFESFLTATEEAALNAG
jgi:hypothetical protein